MFERFSGSARRTVVLAQEETCGLNHNHVGSEHLLLTLTRNKDDTLGVTHAALRGYIVEVIGERYGRRQLRRLPPPDGCPTTQCWCHLTEALGCAGGMTSSGCNSGRTLQKRTACRKDLPDHVAPATSMTTGSTRMGSAGGASRLNPRAVPLTVVGRGWAPRDGCSHAQVATHDHAQPNVQRRLRGRGAPEIIGISYFSSLKRE